MARFEIYRDSAGEYRWRFRADNGNIVADSGQGYSSVRDCMRGVEAIKKQAKKADVKKDNRQ